MKCIVVDDERIAREGLSEFIKAFSFLENVGSFSNAHLALEKLETELVDLIFLDIQMPKFNGMEFANTLSENPTMIIFTTAYPEYALEGYKVNAVDYLIKPVFFEDFKAAVFKAKKIFDLTHQQEESKPLFLKENGALVKVLTSKIMYVQSLQNYIEIRLEDSKRIIVHHTLKYILEQLPDSFIQIHKSYIVNSKYITHIDGSSLFLKEVALPISRKRKEEILKFFTDSKSW